MVRFNSKINVGQVRWYWGRGGEQCNSWERTKKEVLGPLAATAESAGEGSTTGVTRKKLVEAKCLAWVGKYNFFWGDIQRWLIPSSITIYHQIFLSITIHHSVGRAGWKWVGRMNSNWWAVKKTTMVPSLTNVDISPVCKCRWLELKIYKLFWEKSRDVPNKALISLVCKCGLLGLTNAQQPNQQIHISSVRKYMQILEGLYCYMHMLERSVIKITTLTKKDDWS